MHRLRCSGIFMNKHQRILICYSMSKGQLDKAKSCESPWSFMFYNFVLCYFQMKPKVTKPCHPTIFSRSWLTSHRLAQTKPIEKAGKHCYEFVCLCFRFQSEVIFFTHFYTPVFRRDVLWYGDVRPSVRVSVRPSVRHSFPHFSPTCFDILIWNFLYHFIFMHVRSSSNVINFRHFLQELCPFLTSNSYKYEVFRTFLLHALTYWVQILYMNLF